MKVGINGEEAVCPTPSQSEFTGALTGGNKWDYLLSFAVLGFLPQTVSAPHHRLLLVCQYRLDSNGVADFTQDENIIVVFKLHGFRCIHIMFCSSYHCFKF